MVEAERDPNEQGRPGARPGRVFAVITAALFVAVLLNAPELESEAKAKPFGRDRDVWVNIWRPFATVSRALYLDRPRAWIDDALGRDDGGDIFELPVASDTGPSQPQPGGEPTAAKGGADAKRPVATPTPAPPKQLIRTPNADEPLRVWVGGDSMSKVLGEALVRQATETGVMTAVQESQLSSGLTRPDFFDWPGHFNALSKDTNGQEVFVVMFGANDSQGIKTPDGKIFQPGDEGWSVEYRRRVAGTMDVLKGENRMVVWVGQPIMKSDEFSGRMAELNAIYAEEAAKRPWIRFLDLWPLFATSDGKYDAYITDDDGATRLMRHPDGVHLVRDGGERAARAILAVIKKEAGLQ